MLKRLSNHEEGFTLVELLIVILILGVLAAAAVPRFINMQRDAMISTCRNNQASIETAFEQYSYYSTLDPTNCPAPGAGFGVADLALTYNPIINGAAQAVTLLKRAPTCPGGGNYAITIADGTVACTAGH